MHKSWQETIDRAYRSLDKSYQNYLEIDSNYFPQKNNIFNAFNLPKEQTKYILFGQDPYPRKQSAIGYAFIDGAVEKIFSDSGLSKEVNKATSLRNFVKMCLYIEGLIDKTATQEQIAHLDKSQLINSVEALKQNFLRSGVLLLNMGLVFESKKQSRHHIKMWRPFIKELLMQLEGENIELILFGSIAKDIEKLGLNFPMHRLEHPYNASFIQNPLANTIFAPMHLLKK
ncbi:MAG: uracil-DNA glycosylase [Campylobacterota bacterium]